MSDEHIITELRCEILDFEDNCEQLSEAFRVIIVKIDERLMRFLEGRSEYMHRKILGGGVIKTDGSIRFKVSSSNIGTIQKRENGVWKDIEFAG